MGLFTKVPHVCGESNHDFKPRYNKIPPHDVGKIPNFTKDKIYRLDWIEAMTKQEYLFDVCTHCGKIIK